MTKIYNKSGIKEKRQALRNDMTHAEKLIWARLRNRQVQKARFRRQYSVGPYIVDFYCPAIKLAVEIDGQSHRGMEAHACDLERQTSIEQMGIRVIRFTNNEVFNNLDWVMEVIKETVIKLGSQRRTNPL